MKHLLGSIFSILALAVFYLELAGKKIAFLPEGYRAGFYILFILGIIACSVGGMGANAAGGKLNWTSPFTIAGCVLGVAAIVLLALVATHRHFWLIQSDRDAVLVIGAIIAVKWVLSLIHSLFT